MSDQLRTISPISVSAVLAAATAALAVTQIQLEVTTASKAREMASRRLTEIEGARELLDRQEDALEDFMRLLTQIPAAGSVGEGVAMAVKR
jgi:Arc/MetJ family transcription regulator